MEKPSPIHAFAIMHRIGKRGLHAAAAAHREARVGGMQRPTRNPGRGRVPAWQSARLAAMQDPRRARHWLDSQHGAPNPTHGRRISHAGGKAYSRRELPNTRNR